MVMMSRVFTASAARAPVTASAIAAKTTTDLDIDHLPDRAQQGRIFQRARRTAQSVAVYWLDDKTQADGTRRRRVTAPKKRPHRFRTAAVRPRRPGLSRWRGRFSRPAADGRS